MHRHLRGRALPLVALLASPVAAAFDPPTASGDLLVTEIMTEPQLVPNYFGQWFELVNTTSRTLDLNGVVIRDGGGEEIAIVGQTLVAAGDWIVLGVSSDTSRNGHIPVDLVYNFNDFRVDKTGDEIIVTYNNQVIDEVRWTSGWGFSSISAAQLAPQGRLEWANDLAVNWCDSESYIQGGLNGTPGAANHYCLLAGQDNDQDGFTEQQGDCNDDDAYVNPETVDGAGGFFGDADDDADCDGDRDDGTRDDDRDGFAEVDGDCDDTDANISPTRGEGRTPDGRDNDCNCWIDDVDNDQDLFPDIPGATWDPGIFATAPDAPFCDDADEGDCDDSAYSVHPGAEEIPYDGVDQDCDGEDVCDVDGDNYDAEACGGNDCDDDNDRVYPGAPDAFVEPDGLDNNCDGIIDSPDRDGDGWGVAEGDCDDDDAEVNPGISVDRCDDFKDNNCDGWYNEGCDQPALTAGVRGGGLLCGALPGGSGGLPLAALALTLAVARRRRDEASC